MQTAPVGLVGLGLMGTALARRLLDAGFAVRGFDIDAAKRASFAALGGTEAESIVEIAAACPIVVLAVFSTEQVEQVVDARREETPHEAYVAALEAAGLARAVSPEDFAGACAPCGAPCPSKK